MWTRALLKENAKIAFKRNYWTCVIVSVLLAILGVGAEGSSGASFSYNFDGSDSNISMDFSGQQFILMSLVAVGVLIALVIALVFATFVTNIIMIGGKRYFIENREHKTSVGQVFYGFQSGNYLNCVKTMFFRGLYTFGWTLLFVIPGIIKSFSYQLVPYILAENPNLSKDRAIELSCEMMDGHKFESFILSWSFILWDILNVMTIGILGIFYLNPYKHATYAEFYSAIKAEAFNRGITNEIELPGVSLRGPEVQPEFHQEFAEQEDIFAED